MNIRKIIKEEIDNFDWVNERETPLSWLIYNFGELTPVNMGDKTFYVDGNKNPIFYYYQGKKNKSCYINYGEIWSVLGSRFEFNYKKIQKVITRWLDELYGITGRTPIENHVTLKPLLDEV